MPEELELIKRAAGGDDTAFEQLVNQYQKPVYNLAYRMCGNADDAFDLSQEAFLNAWKGLKGFQFQSSFSTWLYRLTSNVCLSYLRSKKRKSAVSLVFLDDEEEEQEWEIADSAPLPEEQTISKEERRQVESALNSLEVEYREALTLSVYSGLSYQQIAEIQGVQEGTVKSRIFRAREKIRRIIQSGNNSSPSASNSAKD
ncbi:MAG: sigma-70 family RNA polymerase sigma factor [Oscillospiraceae bacterium]|nr:sigma-70 family RNA polymerase sigma factor [Oscillospiraceae bacterium]